MKNRYWSIILVLVQVVCFLTVQQNAHAQIGAEERERLVQKASALRKVEDYNGAVQQLDSILLRAANDAPILLFKGDLLLQGKRFADAAATYKQLLPLNFERTITQINLSYALFMNHHPANALQFARSAWQENKSNSGAVINYFNALLWNLKTKDAALFLKQQGQILTPAQKLVLQARLFTTSGNYKQGLSYYDSLVKAYPDKYYVQEYAEVMLGKKDYQYSQTLMDDNRSLFSVNEFKAYEAKVNAAKQQNAGTEFVYFKDVAKNIRIENSIWWQQNEMRVWRFRVSAGATTITSAQQEKTTTQFAHVHIDERWSKAWTGETDVHLQLIQASSNNRFSGLTGQQTVKYQPNDRRMAGVFYSTDILNFTAALLGKNIRSNNAGYVTHLMLDGKTGFYSQGSAGILSDNNRRFQLFASLYRLFRTEPTVKMGLNLSALHFSDSSIKTYFSPNRYLNTELFADYSTALPQLSKFYLQVQAAAGMQQIENAKWEPSLRFQSELGFRLKQFETGLKYQTSNVASNNGTGYKFNWFTFRLMWKWK